MRHRETEHSHSRIERALGPYLEGAYQVDRGAFGSSGHPRSFFRQALEIHGSTFFVARQDDLIVGYALGGRVGDAPGSAWVLSLAVHPDWQRRGVGSTLLDHLLSRMRDQGTQRVRVAADPLDSGLHALFVRAGFQRESLHENYFGPGADRTILRTEL